MVMMRMMVTMVMVMMMMMIKMTRVRIVTVYNLADKVHAHGHARGEEETQFLQNQNVLAGQLLKTGKH